MSVHRAGMGEDSQLGFFFCLSKVSVTCQALELPPLGLPAVTELCYITLPGNAHLLLIEMLASRNHRQLVAEVV